MTGSPEDINWDQRREELTSEVETAVQEFWVFVNEPERAEIVRLANWEVIKNGWSADRPFAVEEYVSEHDPGQLQLALDLGKVLQKLNGCLVSYVTYERPEYLGIVPVVQDDGSLEVEKVYGQPNNEPDIVYVKDYEITLRLGQWLVGLNILDLPYTQEDIDRENAMILPISLMQDLRVIKLPEEPTLDIS